MKRSKNIFNSPIAHQSLLEEEGNRDFKIGIKNVTSNWLADVPEHEYRRYLISALQLSVLQKDLDDLRQGEQNKKSNIFKIVKTRRKLDSLQLLELDDEKPQQRFLQKNEPPSTENLVIQKISAGFFRSILQRKCKIQDKELFIQSLKDQNNKWIPIKIENYSLELEKKENPLEQDSFKDFLWINQFTCRLRLSAPESKLYCIYGEEGDLKKLQRYFQVQNIEVKQLKVFSTLDNQLHQKIVTLFGNKLRFYDHNTKIRKAEKDAQMIAIQAMEKQLDKIQENVDPQQYGKNKEKSSQGHSSEHFNDPEQSGFIEPENKHAEKVQVSALNLENRSISKSKIQKQKKMQSQTFKLKVKSSTVFYEQIEDPIEFDDKEGYSIADLKLGLKEEIGMSEVDEESEKSRSVMSQKLEAKKKITKMTLENILDHSEKFNINIYEVSSNVEEEVEKGPTQSEDKSLSLHSKEESPNDPFLMEDKSDDYFKRHNSLKISHISKRAGERKSSEVDAIMDYFELEKARPNDKDVEDSIDSGKSSLGDRAFGKEKFFLIKNFKKKRINEVEVVRNNREEKTHFAVSQIRMMMPYQTDSMNFQILQVDPELEMQKKIVSCGFVEGTMTEKIVNGQRYMLYTSQKGLHFKMSHQSHYFIFVLLEESKCHYIHFEMDPAPKYQRNYSQLLKTKLDKQGYPFAICLVLYASPEPIVLKPPLSTIEFMKKYLKESQNYDFKLNFIDDKRRIHQIQKQWNKIQIREALSAGDETAFAKSVFLGMSDSIFKHLKKKVPYNPRKLFDFTENESKMIEDNVLNHLMEIKSFMKPTALVSSIIGTTFNQSLKERLEHVYVYCLNRYGSVRNLALVLVKVILDKLEPILMLCRREEEVTGVIQLYGEVQYEIDDLFREMSRFFKK